MAALQRRDGMAQKFAQRRRPLATGIFRKRLTFRGAAKRTSAPGYGKALLRRSFRRRPMRHHRFRHSGRRFGRRHRLGGLTRSNNVHIRNIAGIPDSMMVKLKYSTTESFTAASGGSVFQTIKLNSMHDPYSPLTDNPSGYAEMYSRYSRAIVYASKLTVRLWSGAEAADEEPFRMVVIPCNSVQLTAYQSYSNVIAMDNAPHAKMKIFSPGATLPTLTHYMKTSILDTADNRESDADIVGDLAAPADTDPARLFTWLIGMQTFAGTTTLNVQIQVQCEYYVKFFRLVAPNEQTLIERNRNGNEVKPRKPMKQEEKKESKPEPKIPPQPEVPPGYVLVKKQ